MSSRSANDGMHFDDTSVSADLLKSLSRMRQSGELTDVTLKADGVLVPCHRVVLSASSPYFHAMFTAGFEESRLATVEIKSMDHATLRTIVDYVYSSEIDITTLNVLNLVQASNEFQFETLKTACERYMVQQVDVENCIGFYKLAKHFNLNLEVLQGEARRVMLTKFRSVMNTAEFLELTEAELIEYISDSKVDVVNEDPVFEAVTTWVNSNLPDRGDAFERVVAEVRLPFCTSPYLYDVVVNHPLMSTRVCLDYLEEAQKFHQMPDSRYEITSPRKNPRKSFRIHRLVVIGGLAADNQNNTDCLYYNEETDSWEFLTQIPSASRCSSICTIGSEIMLMGGSRCAGKRARKAFWVFDTVDNEWRNGCPLSSARSNHAVVVHDHMIFIVGGNRDLTTLGPRGDVNEFDHSLGLWNEFTVPSLRKPLRFPMAVSHDGSVYVFGGLDECGPSTTTQQYDETNRVWLEKADMPQACKGGGAVSVNDRIFVVGGKNCMCYTPHSDVWSILTGPCDVHDYAAVTVWNGKILVGGGELDGARRTSVIEEYDPEKDSWSYWKTPLKEGLAAHYMFGVDLPWPSAP